MDPLVIPQATMMVSGQPIADRLAVQGLMRTPGTHALAHAPLGGIPIEMPVWKGRRRAAAWPGTC